MRTTLPWPKLPWQNVSKWIAPMAITRLLLQLPKAIIRRSLLIQGRNQSILTIAEKNGDSGCIDHRNAPLFSSRFLRVWSLEWSWRSNELQPLFRHVHSTRPVLYGPWDYGHISRSLLHHTGHQIILRYKNHLTRAGRTYEAGVLAKRVRMEVTQQNSLLMVDRDTCKNTKWTWTKVHHILCVCDREPDVVGVTANILNDHYAAISTDHSCTSEPS